MYAMLVLKAILPFDAFERVYNIMGGYHMIHNQDIGRKSNINEDLNHLNNNSIDRENIGL